MEYLDFVLKYGVVPLLGWLLYLERKISRIEREVGERIGRDELQRLEDKIDRKLDNIMSILIKKDKK
jgi:predicted component of type VI protein secretion system